MEHSRLDWRDWIESNFFIIFWKGEKRSSACEKMLPRKWDLTDNSRWRESKKSGPFLAIDVRTNILYLEPAGFHLELTVDWIKEKVNIYLDLEKKKKLWSRSLIREVWRQRIPKVLTGSSIYPFSVKRLSRSTIDLSDESACDFASLWSDSGKCPQNR